MNVEIQAAPAQATVSLMSPKVDTVRICITLHFKSVMVPLVSALSIGDSSISAIPNPILAERGVLAVAA